MSLAWAELERAGGAVLDSFPNGAKLDQLVELSLTEQLGHIVNPNQPLRGQVFDLLRWARSHHRLTELLGGALAANPGNPQLASVVPPLLARLAGEPAAGERVEVPVLAPGDATRGLMLIAAREHAEQLSALEDALGALRGPDGATGPDALPVVARRYLDPDQPPAAPHPNLAHVRVAVMLVGRDLTASSYLWTAEAAELIDRHYARTLRLVPVLLGGFIHATSRLAGLPVVDGQVDGKPLDADALAVRVAGAIVEDTGAGSGAVSLGDYVDEVRRRLAELDRGVDGFVEPTKAILVPGGDRRLARARRGTTARAPLAAILEQHAVDRAVAVLGEPGSGKSVLLRRLAGHHLARLAAGDRRALVPVYVKLAAYTERAGDEPAPFIDFLRRALATGPARERHVARELEPLLAEKRLLVLLDGMDEMPRVDFTARTARLRDFVKQYECRTVLACRERDFESAQLDVLQVRLRPFSDREIAEHLEAVVGLARRQAAADVRVLTRSDHPLAGVVRNPLSLGLIAHQRAADGDYPATVGELFRGYVQRALDPAVTGQDVATLRADIAVVGFEMAAQGSPGTAVPLAEVMVGMAGRTRHPVPDVIAAGVASGLLRRDDSTGALLFSHARVQELFIAAHLVHLEPAVRRPWLEAHAGELWFDEVYVLAAREGLDCAELVGWVVREAAALLDRAGRSLARDAELELHERRLILLGRLADSAGLPAAVLAPAAELLERLWHEADRQLAPGRTRIAVLQAARGAMLERAPLLAAVAGAARSRSAGQRREAWRALASHGDLGTVRRAVLRQAASTNYLRHAPGDQRLAGVEPRLARVQRWSSVALGLHLGLLVTSTLLCAAAIAAVGGRASWLVTVSVVAVFHMLGLSRRQDGEPSTVRLVGLAGLAGLAAAIGTRVPEALVRSAQAVGGADAAPVHAVEREPLLLYIIGI
ncbi:MAG TPA: effector-associated domain EAD1-containing protein, partial [Kofleriaceae bacterium]|nr:effector-associated domain EAD1-containing protein [Kofleriaceae bacterium]